MPRGTMICLLSCMLLGPTTLDAEPAHRLAQIRAVQELYGTTVRLAEFQFERFKKANEEISREAHRKIKSELARENDVHVLAEFASVLKAGHGGLAGDQAVDQVFEDAWFAAIFRIEEIGGKDALEELKDMRARDRLDGAFSLTVKEAMTRIERRQKSQ